MLAGCSPCRLKKSVLRPSAPNYILVQNLVNLNILVDTLVIPVTRSGV
jgi:hypothetical protein